MPASCLWPEATRRASVRRSVSIRRVLPSSRSRFGCPLPSGQFPSSACWSTRCGPMRRPRATIEPSHGKSIDLGDRGRLFLDDLITQSEFGDGLADAVEQFDGNHVLLHRNMLHRKLGKNEPSLPLGLL